MLHRRAALFALTIGVAVATLQAASVSVSVTDFAFNPQDAQAVVGDTVTFTAAAGSGFHVLVWDNGPFPPSPAFAPSPYIQPSYAITVTTAGVFPYHCSFHANTGTLTVIKSDVTMSLTTSKDQTTYGESATLTATVAPFGGGPGMPTGTVTFRDGAADLCVNATLNAGAATCSTAPLAFGGHTIFATYNGDANYNTFSGASVNQLVNRGTTTTTLVSSASGTVPYGTNVTFTATITIVAPGNGSPGGFVTMTDGSSPTNVCTSADVVNGSASCSTTTLGGGSHPITAFYSGDANVDGSTSDTVVQKVTPQAPQNFVAKATSTSQVSVTWTPSEGTGSYNVYRQTLFGQMPFLFASPGMPPVTDTGAGLPPPGLHPDTTYLYRAEAVGTSGSGTSPLSLLELATTTIFSDPSLSGIAIKAEHIDSLRRAVNAVRRAAGLQDATFTDDPPVTHTTPINTIPIKRIHITEIRNALDPALAAMGFPSIIYTDPAITQNGTLIKAAHVSQPREGTQ